MRTLDHDHEAGNGWPFLDPPNVATYVSASISEQGAPIFGIMHDEDGDWQFLDDGPNDADDCRIVCLHCMWSGHPEIAEHASLPLGWQAWKQDSGEWALLKPSFLDRLRFRFLNH